MMSNRYVPTAVGFQRVNKEPLEKYETFNSIDDMVSYVSRGTAYPGQVCKVKFSNDLSLEYLINSSGIVPLYNIDPIERNIINDNEFEKYGFTEVIETVPNQSTHTGKWELFYNYDPDSGKLYTDPELYNPSSFTFSILANMQLYDSKDGINFLLVVNGVVKYKWKQTIDFMKSTMIKHDLMIANANDGRYLKILMLDGKNTGYGLFPEIKMDDHISLYVGI